MASSSHQVPFRNHGDDFHDGSSVSQLNSAPRRSHSTRRVFVGPMPEKAIVHMENAVKKQKMGTGEFTLSQLEDIAPEKSDDVVRVVQNHARRFVEHYRGGNRGDSGVGGGGGGAGSARQPRTRKTSSVSHGQTDDGDYVSSNATTEGWDDDDDQNLVEELIHRWKESEWGQAWRHRHSRNKRTEKFAPQHWIGGSFEVGVLLGVNMLDAQHQVQDNVPALTSESGPVAGTHSIASGTQGVQSLETPAERLSNDFVANSRVKGKQRQVHYVEPLPEIDVGAPPPAPPQAVLARTQSELDPTSSQAAMLSPAVSSPGLQWGEVFMRDRMLVRVMYSKQESLSTKFDDLINRTTRDLQFEDWAEFMVVWRKDYIELYEDHSLPGKELFSSHKHLAFVIPLKCPRTNLSLYSFVDLTFCVTCPPTSTHEAAGSRRIFRSSRGGTNIFIFKHKNRSKAWDWTWQLWRNLGGQIPTSVEVYNPGLNSTVTIDIPYRLQIDNQELYAMFTRENIVKLCIESLCSVPDWFALAETELVQHGKRLELCWRRDANLDWLWLDEDIYGKSRPWATLAGLAVKQSSQPAALEIRLTSHAPTHYHLKNDAKVVEPPSVEGYVQRIRPNTQTKQSLYISTHNGLLFTNHVHEAYPPSPPGLALTTQDMDSWVKGLRQAEILRGANQVLHATGVCDLRNVAAVRRAFQILPPVKHEEKDSGADDNTWFSVWSQEEHTTLDDDSDLGGELYLNQHLDRNVVRMRRCFELLLNTGHVIRFETHSRRVAIEWVNRLRPLIGFWKHKKRINAKEEIELAQARRPRLTPQVRVCQKEEFPPEPPADMSGHYPAMSSLYNWCIIEGCHPITKVGKLYIRNGLRGSYKLFCLALVAGHLVWFRIKPGSSLHPASGEKINLLDANVFSGYFAAMNLPTGQFNANQPAAPRRYLDGLETDDRDEDMLFMLWFRPHPATDAANAPTVAPVPSKSIPALSAKNKMFVFKTRSRIERDAWVWALNTEIEKIAQVQSEREEKLKETGKLVCLK